MGKKKLTYEFVKNSFEKEDYVLLSTEYINAHKKLNYICPQGHKHSICWNHWKSSKRCPYCANNIKPTIEFVRSEFEKENYKLLTTEYINNEQKLDYICPNGHQHNISWGSWISGHRCIYCSRRPPIDLKFIKEQFEKECYTLLTKKYSNAHQKLDYICPNSHKHSITWNDWKQGIRCPYCSNKIKKTVEFIKSEFEKEGYKLLSDEYVNAHTLLKFKCNEGHVGKISWSSWRRGSRCLECSGKLKKSLFFVKSEFIKEGYNLLTSEYINSHQILECICPNGHLYKVPWKNWRGKNYRCPKCNEVGISKQELKLLEFIKLVYNGDIIEHDRSIIKPYELDIVIPDKKIAIEYCGLYWHSELLGRDRKYHLNKLNLCEKVGYRLITIFEDEFINNKEIVFSFLKNLLFVSSAQVIYARNCVIKEISVLEARKFCEENHLQGYHGSKIKLGAFHKNELVSVMTFSHGNIAKGSKNIDKVWELNRFCSKINYRVVGISSKLLKYFERNYTWDGIFSYADRRWFSGDLYNNLGFEFNNNTSPNYWYFKNNKRMHRFGLRKTMDDPKNVTEWEIRKSQGYNRIWDCGNLKFAKYNSD